LTSSHRISLSLIQHPIYDGALKTKIKADEGEFNAMMTDEKQKALRGRVCPA
jgi:hypothetical protein